MATTARTKDFALGKERKGTSPSKSQTTHSQRSGSRQSSSCTSTDKEKSSTPSENKHIPNYLRPTIASSNDASRLGNKNSNEDNQKLLRRRSFDKPPSASPRGQKALISPARRDHRASPGSPAPAVPREKKLTVRSSSFSGKTIVSSLKPVPDARASKTPKPVKQPFFAKNPKKSLTSLSKKESNNNNNNNNNNASSSTKASSSHDTARTLLEHEAKQEEKEAVVHEVEEKLKGESENQIVHAQHVPKSENGEDIDSLFTEVLHGGEDEKINSSDISTCTSEDLTVAPSPQLIIEETDNHHHDHENTSVHEVKSNTEQKEKENVISKSESCIDNTPPEEVVIEEVKAIGEDQSNETDQENPISSEGIGDDQNKVEEGSDGVKAEEAVQELEGGGDDHHHHDQLEEAKQEQDQAANAVSIKRQGGQGNKELPPAYNDVIEETASKLLEKRKNKVKALVGAFETVIDYESGASKESPKDH